MEKKQLKIFLAYFFLFISGLILLLTERDEEIRFHAAQSFVVFLSLLVFHLLLEILAFLFIPIFILPILGDFFYLMFSTIFLILRWATFIIWIIFIVKVLLKDYPKIKFIEKWTKKVEKLIQP